MRYESRTAVRARIPNRAMARSRLTASAALIIEPRSGASDTGGKTASRSTAQREIAARQARIKLLESDPRAQEVEIRQRLKLAAPGEKVYILDEHGK